MNKIILVTGGNRGIGKEICTQLAAQGHILILGSRDLAKGEATAVSIEGTVVAKKLEVTSDQDIQALAKAIKDEYGKLDVLINNAGVFAEASVLTETLENMRKVMNNNVFAPQRMVQLMLPLLNKADAPRIVNLSSAMGQVAQQTGDHSAYRLSKFALNGLTIQLANELPDIKVMCMHPGWVRTDMGGPQASLSVQEGADTAVWLATADGVVTGRFYDQRKVLGW